MINFNPLRGFYKAMHGGELSDKIECETKWNLD